MRKWKVLASPLYGSSISPIEVLYFCLEAGREWKWIIPSPQPFNRPVSLNYTQYYCTGPAEHWYPQGRCGETHNDWCSAPLKSIDSVQRLTSRSWLIVQRQQWIHLCDNLSFSSKHLPCKVHVPKSSVLMPLQGKLPPHLIARMLRELSELEAKLGFLFSFQFPSSRSIDIMRAFSGVIILWRGVSIAILFYFCGN